MNNNIGTLDKKTKGCTKSMVSDADNFEVEFPRMLQKPEHRALLVVATIFMDMWFEEKARSNEDDDI